MVGVTALATDPDVSDTVTYSLTDDAGGRFTIDTNSGVVTVAISSFDAETEASIDIDVTATSSDLSTSVQTFSIAVTDVNESMVGPVTDSDATADTLAEDATAGNAVGVTGLATDADVGDTVSYSLTAGGDTTRFVIDAGSGIVTVAGGASFDAETEASINIEVTATSFGHVDLAAGSSRSL